jgi:HEAT repeat protein
MESDSPNICHEAVRAAGELEIKEALPRLFKFLESDDVNIRMAAAWSLSQIGGEGVRQRLEALYDEAEDEEEADFIDSALENLDFTEDVEIFELLEMDEDEEDKDYDLFDWEEEEDED